MKEVNVPPQSMDVNSLLDQARDEDLLVRAVDGTEFMVFVVDDFDLEVARTRRNAELMAILDERAKQTQSVPLDEVKRQLGLQ